LTPLLAAAGRCWPPSAAVGRPPAARRRPPPLRCVSGRADGARGPGVGSGPRDGVPANGRP